MATRADGVGTTIIRLNSKLTANAGDGSSNPTVGATTSVATAAATATATAADTKSYAEQKPPHLVLHPPPPSIEEIARRPSAREALHEFAHASLVSENVNFLLEIISLENQLNDAIAANPNCTLEEIEKDKGFQEKFQIIYARFILERASQWISISGSMRAALNTQNNGNSPTTPKPTAFKFATFQQIYEGIKFDLDAPLKAFDAQFQAARKSRPKPQRSPGVKRSHSYSLKRGQIAANADASLGSAAAATASATATAKAAVRQSLVVHVKPHFAQIAQPLTGGSTARPPLSRSATLGTAAIETGIMGASATPALLYMYPPPNLSAASSTAVLDLSAGSLNAGSQPLTTRSVDPALDTKPGTGTSARPSPIIAAVASDLPMPSNPNLYSKPHKNAVTSLVKQLGEYLQTIISYEHDEACCTCCCFRSCKKDKPAIYRNMRDLKDSLSLSLDGWADEKIENVRSLISTALEDHKRLAGNAEQQIVVSLNTAVSTLNGYKHIEPSTFRRQS